jgi:ubiquinone/menaquinone biosynthesis C-methylase UbiE
MQSTRSDVSDKESIYFDFQAEVGLTKHIGSVKATNELISLCKIESGKHVLDVGCGVGITDVYLAREYNVNITGIDVNAGMLKRAKNYSEEDKVEDITCYITADAQNLPFIDDYFDAVICESLLVFVSDKNQALSEFIRVTKPGYYVGFTESIWRGNKKEKMDEFLKKTADPQARMETHETWVEILEESELIDTVAHEYDVSITDYMWKQIKRIGVWRFLKVWGRTFRLFLTSGKYRGFVLESSKLPLDLVEYIGYGVYTGKKPSKE